MNQQLKFFSIFSGTLYTISDHLVKHMDCGQVPIVEFPDHTCKVCYGRGYDGVDTKTGHYHMCKCLIKLIDQSRIVHKEVNDIPFVTKYG